MSGLRCQAGNRLHIQLAADRRELQRLASQAARRVQPDMTAIRAAKEQIASSRRELAEHEAECETCASRQAAS